MEDTVAMRPTSANALQSLPAEIITSIADHLRSLPHTREEYTPRQASVCSCSQVTPLKFAKAQLKSLGYYQDEALAMGMTCRRLREIAFMQRLGRTVSINALCKNASRDTCHMPEILKNHVRTLRIEADPDHEPTRSLGGDINYLLEYFPKADKLIVDWRIFLSGTEDRLYKLQDIYAEPETRELEIYVGNKSSGIASAEDPEEMTSAIAAETRDLFAHLHLPCLESLLVRIDINDRVPDDADVLDAIVESIKLERWGKTLKRVNLVISFNLDEEPHQEIVDGLSLVDELLLNIICNGPRDVRVTLNLFFPPKDFRHRPDAIRRLHPTRLRHHIIGNIDVDSLVGEETMRKITRHLAMYPTLERAEVRVTGSTSNGWQHHERTLASTSYTRPDAAVASSSTNTESAHETFTRNTQGAQELCEIITEIVRQTGEGIPRAEMQARADWMALRGMVEQSRVTGREPGWWD